MTEDQEGYVAIGFILSPFIILFILTLMHEAGWF